MEVRKMSKVEKWILFMVVSAIGMVICCTLITVVAPDGVNLGGKIIAIIFGLFVGLWIVSFIEFIAQVVKNKRRKNENRL